MILVTFESGLPTGEHRCVRGMFRHGVTSKEAVLPERRGGKQLPRDEIAANNRDGQQNQAKDLRWHFGAARVAHVILFSL